MKKRALLERLWDDKREFISADDLRGYCSRFGMEYADLVNYLTKMRYVMRIFRGTFYIRSPDEIMRRRDRYSYLQLVSRGMEMKGVKSWYFGLHTALKLNHMTHEYFEIDYVVSDSVFRPRPVEIAGCKIKFTKLAGGLFGFGVKRGNTVHYSDPEKTVLDLIYVAKQDGTPDARIAMDASEFADRLSPERMVEYSRWYPKTVAKIAGDAVR